MKNINTLLFIGILSLLFACQDGPPAQNESSNKTDDSSTTTSSETNDTESTETKPLSASDSTSMQKDDLRYAWVDKLSIRSTPSTKGEVITLVKSETPLRFTGEQSAETESIVLRSVAYDEYWLKVITPDQKEGWVFGGAVKRQGEDKGNGIIDNNSFDFPRFGSFQLADWKKQTNKDESGGDASIETSLYKKGNQYLEISASDVGEYGYSYSYKLMDANKKMVKEREFSFSADISEMSETVKDYAASPPMQYVRTQKVKQHFSQMNAKPMMVRGEWVASKMQ